jgi:hypothetical protein
VLAGLGSKFGLVGLGFGVKFGLDGLPYNGRSPRGRDISWVASDQEVGH